MATMNKHKQRSRKTWQATAATRKHIFGIMEQYAAGVLSNRMMKQLDNAKEGI